MAKKAYDALTMRAAKRYMVNIANSILEEYSAMGYDMTLRQLFYQIVARDLFPDDQTWVNVGGDKWRRDPSGTKNATPNYKWLGDVVSDGRMQGLIDWNYVVDRTRELSDVSTWDDPAAIISAAASGYRIDSWADQPYHVEAWVEKEALIGVVEPVAHQLGVGAFACRGYASQTAMWEASRRFLDAFNEGKQVRILHLGDHDPSGIDMTRDVDERLFKFLAVDHWRGKMEGSGEKVEASIEFVRDNFSVKRLALNMDQVEQYDPPPNPAKMTDSRANSYVDEYGDLSWELDALPPDVLGGLVESEVDALIDADLWRVAEKRQEDEVALLQATSDRWDEVVELVS